MQRLMFTAGFVLVLFLAGLTARGEQPPRFAVYRVDLLENQSATPFKRDDRRYFHTYVTQKYLLTTAEKVGPPILTEADIEEYCWTTQKVQLTAAGASRWDAQGGFEVPLDGLPILIEVDGVPRYGAMIWNPLSSMSCRLPQFWSWTRENRLTFGGKYVSAEGDTIYRENFDPLVRKIMGELGKLSEDCGEN